jgi:hypothetical protein
MCSSVQLIEPKPFAARYLYLLARSRTSRLCSAPYSTEAFVVNSARYAEYRQHSDEALQMALTAVTDNYRVWWLELAQSWLEMIPSEHFEQSASHPISVDGGTVSPR